MQFILTDLTRSCMQKNRAAGAGRILAVTLRVSIWELRWVLANIMSFELSTTLKADKFYW